MSNAWKFGLVVAVILGIAAAAGYLVDSKYREWDARMQKAEARALELEATATAARREADEAKRAAVDSGAVAQSLRERNRERIVEIREVPLPPGCDSLCESLVAERDDVIDSLRVEADTWRSSYDQAMRAIVALEQANDSLQVALDTLQVVAADRPKPRSPWFPKITVGPQAGCGMNGCYVGGGVTIGWEVPWP